MAGVSHCANMMAVADTDSQEMANARAEIDRLIGEWLTSAALNLGSNFVAKLLTGFHILIATIYAIY